MNEIPLEEDSQYQIVNPFMNKNQYLIINQCQNGRSRKSSSRPRLSEIPSSAIEVLSDQEEKEMIKNIFQQELFKVKVQEAKLTKSKFIILKTLYTEIYFPHLSNDQKNKKFTLIMKGFIAENLKTAKNEPFDMRKSYFYEKMVPKSNVALGGSLGLNTSTLSQKPTVQYVQNQYILFGTDLLSQKQIQKFFSKQKPIIKWLNASNCLLTFMKKLQGWQAVVQNCPNIDTLQKNLASQKNAKVEVLELLNMLDLQQNQQEMIQTQKDIKEGTPAYKMVQDYEKFEKFKKQYRLIREYVELNPYYEMQCKRRLMIRNATLGEQLLGCKIKPVSPNSSQIHPPSTNINISHSISIQPLSSISSPQYISYIQIKQQFLNSIQNNPMVKPKYLQIKQQEQKQKQMIKLKGKYGRKQRGEGGNNIFLGNNINNYNNNAYGYNGYNKNVYNYNYNNKNNTIYGNNSNNIYKVNGYSNNNNKNPPYNNNQTYYYNPTQQQQQFQYIANNINNNMNNMNSINNFNNSIYNTYSNTNKIDKNSNKLYQQRNRSRDYTCKSYKNNNKKNNNYNNNNNQNNYQNNNNKRFNNYKQRKKYNVQMDFQKYIQQRDGFRIDENKRGVNDYSYGRDYQYQYSGRNGYIQQQAYYNQYNYNNNNNNNIIKSNVGQQKIVFQSQSQQQHSYIYYGKKIDHKNKNNNDLLSMSIIGSDNHNNKQKNSEKSLQSNFIDPESQKIANNKMVGFVNGMNNNNMFNLNNNNNNNFNCNNLINNNNNNNNNNLGHNSNTNNLNLQQILNKCVFQDSSQWKQYQQQPNSINHPTNIIFNINQNKNIIKNQQQKQKQKQKQQQNQSVRKITIMKKDNKQKQIQQQYQQQRPNNNNQYEQNRNCYQHEHEQYQQSQSSDLDFILNQTNNKQSKQKKYKFKKNLIKNIDQTYQTKVQQQKQQQIAKTKIQQMLKMNHQMIKIQPDYNDNNNQQIDNQMINSQSFNQSQDQGILEEQRYNNNNNNNFLLSQINLKTKSQVIKQNNNLKYPHSINQQQTYNNNKNNNKHNHNNNKLLIKNSNIKPVQIMNQVMSGMGMIKSHVITNNMVMINNDNINNNNNNSNNNNNNNNNKDYYLNNDNSKVNINQVKKKNPKKKNNI